MKIHLAGLVFGSICAPICAQQEYGIVPGGGSFASRGSLGGAAGELLQGVHASHHRGVAEVGGACAIDGGFRIHAQDQDGSTQEAYSLVVRGGTDAAGPNLVFAGIGPFRTPPGPGGPAAWSLTHRLSAPIALVDCTSFFSFGVQVVAAPTWPRNGLSFLMAAMSSQCSHARQGDHAWQIDAAGVVTHPPLQGSWVFYLQVRRASLLQLGNGGSLYGMGGMFPAVGCAFTARTRFPAASIGGGTSLLFAGLNRTAGILLFPGTAQVYLGGIVVPMGSAPVGADGQAVHQILGSVPVTPAGTQIHFQAVGVMGANRAVTNCHTATT